MRQVVSLKDAFKRKYLKINGRNLFVVKADVDYFLAHPGNKYIGSPSAGSQLMV